jgi:hypothetical protein
LVKDAGSLLPSAQMGRLKILARVREQQAAVQLRPRKLPYMMMCGCVGVWVCVCDPKTWR